MSPSPSLQSRSLLEPPSKSLLSFPCPQNELQEMQDSLSKPSQSYKNGEEPYVHPLLSKPFLSSKSLEMCTESLGSETGSGIEQFSHLAAENCGGIQHARKQQKPIKKAPSFPPPLTSSGGLQVHTHREGGRLVIKAFAFCSFFQAERGNGRLRLSLLKDGRDEEEEVVCDGGDEDRLWGENVKEEGGKVWSSSSSRCNGDMSNRKKRLQQSLQFCVVGV